MGKENTIAPVLAPLDANWFINADPISREVKKAVTAHMKASAQTVFGDNLVRERWHVMLDGPTISPTIKGHLTSPESQYASGMIEVAKKSGWQTGTADSKFQYLAANVLLHLTEKEKERLGARTLNNVDTYVPPTDIFEEWKASGYADPKAYAQRVKAAVEPDESLSVTVAVLTKQIAEMKERVGVFAETQKLSMEQSKLDLLTEIILIKGVAKQRKLLADM